MQPNRYRFPTLSTESVEFFHNDTMLMVIEEGVIKPFADISLSILDLLSTELDADEEATEALNKMRITDPALRLEQFATCRYGDFNNRPDIHGGDRDLEYYDCGQRGVCKFEGRLCKRMNAQYGVLTRAELRIIKLVTSDLSDEEIACRLFLSIHTIHTHTRARSFQR